MQFIRPEFLYFLAAIAIPIIIHLFNFRKFKRVYFTNVSFLNEVKRQTQSKSRLRHLLVLASRILAIACLVFAFAQPFIPAPDKDVVAGKKAVSIYIDNSFSMDALDKSGSLFANAKRHVRDIVSSYSVNDNFQLLTNDFEGKHQRLVKGEELLEMLEEVSISPVSRSISEVLTRQKDVLQNSDAKAKRAIVISDFQRTMTDPAAISTDTTITTLFIPLEAKLGSNVYIDSVWFRTPIRQINQQEELSVRIRNASDEFLENVPIKLFINGTAKAIGTFNADPRSTVDTTLFFSNGGFGIQHGRVEIQDYPITYDDDFYFSYKIQEKQNILHVHPGASGDTLTKRTGYIRSVYGGDPFFSLKHSGTKNLDYSTLANYSLIILNGLNDISSGMSTELQKYAANGGSVVVFPGDDIKVKAYQEFLLLMGAEPVATLDTAKTKVIQLNTMSEIYRSVFEEVPDNIDLPLVSQRYPISSVLSSGREALMELPGSEPFVCVYPVGKGKFYMSCVALNPDFSNFQRHALFVTTMLRIAEFAQPHGRPFYTIGKDEMVELNNIATSGDAVFHLKGAGESETFDIIPEHQNAGGKTNILVHNQIQNAGNFLLQFNNEDITGLGFNYLRDESRIEGYSASDLMDLMKEYGLMQIQIVDAAAEDLQQSLLELSEGKKLWKLFIILALSFLAIEILLLKFWKA